MASCGGQHLRDDVRKHVEHNLDRFTDGTPPSPPLHVLLSFVGVWRLLLRLISVLLLKGRLRLGRLKDHKQIIVAALAWSMSTLMTAKDCVRKAVR